MTSATPPTIATPAAARWLHLPRASSAWLHEEVARRMQERLDWMRLPVTNWLDWEPEIGGLQAHAQLARRYPAAQAYVAGDDETRSRAAVAPLPPWWHPARWLRRAAPRRPDAGVDLLWANMVLHMAADPQALLARWHKELAVDGVLMFSCLGPDTLRELRSLYGGRGWPPPAHAFTDMHDWGDMLVAAGFADPVLDIERIVLTFASPERLLRELRELGRNLHVERFPGLRGRAWHARLCEALAGLGRQDDRGQIALTFEIIYGHAVKPVPRAPVSAEISVSLDEMRLNLRQRKQTIR